jgi:hypothetical protein
MRYVSQMTWVTKGDDFSWVGMAVLNMDACNCPEIQVWKLFGCVAKSRWSQAKVRSWRNQEQILFALDVKEQHNYSDNHSVQTHNSYRTARHIYEWVYRLTWPPTKHMKRHEIRTEKLWVVVNTRGLFMHAVYLLSGYGLTNCVVESSGRSAEGSET